MKAGRSNAIVNLLQRNDSLMATWREGKDERKKTSDQEGMKSLESHALSELTQVRASLPVAMR